MKGTRHMAQKVADPCRNCGAALAPGTSFCTLCGTAVTNRAAAQAPTSIPLVGQPHAAPAPGDQGSAVPGIIPVGLSAAAPLVRPQQVGGDARWAAAAALVPGGAGRRLAAKAIDGVVPGVLMAAAGLLAGLLLEITPEGEIAQGRLSLVLLVLAAASLLSLAYGVWLWLWEARAGKTPGNMMLALRTTGMDGGRAGLGAVFLRSLIIGVGSIVPVVGPVLVIISNTWDANGKWQGWHDKAANTLVFNIKAGRDPLETGGVAGRAEYAPAPVPTLSPVQSPIPVRPAGSLLSARAAGSLLSARAAPSAQFAPSAGGPGEGPITSVPGVSSPAVVPLAPGAPHTGAAQTGVPQAQAPQAIQYTEPVSFAPPASAAPASAAPFGTEVTDPLPGLKVTAPLAPERADGPEAGHADEEAGETRIRPAAEKIRLRLIFDDGSRQDVDTVALIGRNPAGYDGEMISRLITVRDTSMSVSKTHLHVRAGTEGLWVTDRHSTNGSSITSAGGARTALTAGTPALGEAGSRVHFGERSFTVERA